MQHQPKKISENDQPCDTVHDVTDATWEQDQKERGYYYDDAHGYETFDPASDDDEDDETDELA